MLYHGLSEGQPDAVEPDAVQPDAVEPDAVEPDAGPMHLLVVKSGTVGQGQVLPHDFVVESSYVPTGQAPDAVHTLTPVIGHFGGALFGLLGGQEAAATHFCVSGSHTGVAPEHAVTHSPEPIDILPGGQVPIVKQVVPV